MRTTRWLIALGMAALLAFPVTAVDKSEKKLSPQSAEFLSLVRYLITKEERKEFLGLPEDQRSPFIEQFWKKRDSDPASPTNEFQEEYLQRVKQANDLFVGETRPGWLTDRGRIYILYGPPARRETAAPAGGKTRACLETWHYGDFPVVFSDRNCAGTFTLATDDLSLISSLDIARSSTARSLREVKPLPFDFDIHILKRPAPGEILQGLIRLDMPYSQIWFDVKTGVFQTAFVVELTLDDSQKVARWQFKGRYPVQLSAAELKEKQKEKFTIEIPMTIEKDVGSLRAGKCRLSIIMENEVSKESIRKVAEFAF
jgi:GWxTD domain-containing protein